MTESNSTEKQAEELMSGAVCRTREIEARRMLAHLDYANIDDSVCDENSKSITQLIADKKWKMCDKERKDVFAFICNSNVFWANGGYRIIIEGGDEARRKRILDFCIYRGIIALFLKYGRIAKVYDWPSIIPTLRNYKHPERDRIIDSMYPIPILGITELDLMAPRDNGGLDEVLTSVLRQRMLSKLPTLITLKRPSWLCGKLIGGSEINELVCKPYDEASSKVIRIRVLGGESEET